MQLNYGAFLLLSVACFVVLSMPVDGCSLTNGEYLVKIEINRSCPMPENMLSVDGWQAIDKITYNDGSADVTQVKLLKAGPSDSVAAIDWAASAASYMKKKGGKVIATEVVAINGRNGTKIVAVFDYGTSIVIDVPLENNNLFEILARNATEGEQIFDNISEIEKLNITSQ